MTYSRITVDSGVTVSKPVIKGTHSPIEVVLRKISAGWGIPEVLDAYPHLTPKDVSAARVYAADINVTEQNQIAHLYTGSCCE